MSNNLLEIRNLTKVFKTGGLVFGTRLAAVDNVSLAVAADRPAILSIVGESGSGKTTLARILLRLQEPTSGEVQLDGKPLFGRKGTFADTEFRRFVQPVFQNPFEAFSPHKTVDSYLYATAMNLGVAGTRDEATKVIGDILASVGLDLGKVCGKYPHQFSGGELQRVSIARALIPRPRLIIADEPVSALDASLRMNVVNQFLDLKRQFGVSFVYVTHDLSTAYYVSDYIAIMFRGQVVEFGPAGQVLTAPSHPYTQLLMDCVPKVGQKWDTEIDLPDVETVEFAATGCKFASRCQCARDVCRKQRPPMVELGDDRRVLCFKASDFTA